MTPLGYALEVEYNDSTLLTSRNFENTPKVLSRKRLCWEYEKEWRIIEELNKAKKHFDSKGQTRYILDCKQDEISHVVLGINATPAFTSRVVDWLGKSDRRLQRVIIDRETHAFQLKDVMND